MIAFSQCTGSGGAARKGSAVPGALEDVLFFQIGIAIGFAIDGNPGTDSDRDPYTDS